MQLWFCFLILFFVFLEYFWKGRRSLGLCKIAERHLNLKSRGAFRISGSLGFFFFTFASGNARRRRSVPARIVSLHVLSFRVRGGGVFCRAWDPTTDE